MNVASRFGVFLAASLSAVGEGIALDEVRGANLPHGRGNGLFGRMSCSSSTGSKNPGGESKSRL